jgi:hypothetical protein
MGSGTPPVQILQAGAQNDQICTTPLKIIERPPTAQNGGYSRVRY